MEQQPANKPERTESEAAQAVYGALNSAFEDWEKREIPPSGYRARFSFDVPSPVVRIIQDAPDINLHGLGVDDLRHPAKWQLNIGEWHAKGQLGITGLELPLQTPGQRLVFAHDTPFDGVYNAYLRHQDGSYTNLMRSPALDSRYLHELLANAGIDIPPLAVPPPERSLALAHITDQASEFKIVQTYQLPVHPNQEIEFQKVTSRNEPKQASPQPVARGVRRPGSPPKRHSYDTALRAVYRQTDDQGRPLYGQRVSFEGDEAAIDTPLVELFTYEVDPLTGEVQRHRAYSDETISAALLEQISEGLFTAEYGGESPS